jgi:hypothetical protein
MAFDALGVGVLHVGPLISFKLSASRRKTADPRAFRRVAKPLSRV